MRQVIDLAPTLTHGLATGAALDDAGATVAGRLAADAATLAHGFAGAVLLAVLAVRPQARQIVYQAAHDIEIAGPLRTLLALAGAVPAPIGSVDRASLADLEAALSRETAAVLYVADERLAKRHLLDLPTLRHAAHSRNVPTIVLAPLGQNVEGLLDAGADLLVLDATTALAGPPLGILAGRADLVALARAAQDGGLGRLVAPAPDHLATLLALLGGDAAPSLPARRARLAERLAGRPGLRLLPTPTGAALHLDPPIAGTAARDLAHALATGQPALVTDDRDALNGRLALDLVRLDDAAFAAALETIGRTLEKPIPPAPWP